MTPQTIADALRPTFAAAALIDCVQRGQTLANDGSLVDDLISSLCSNTAEGIANGWLVTWDLNPARRDDQYWNRYIPTDLGRQVAAALSEQHTP